MTRISAEEAIPAAEDRVIQSQKDTARPKKRTRAVLLALIALLISLLMLRLGMRAGLSVILPVKKVQIHGNRYVTEGKIIQLLNIDASRSMLLFDREKAGERILGDRRIARAAVVKMYPDTLRVYISEKDASAVIAAGQSYYAVSADGIVLNTAKERDSEVHPLITLKSISDDIRTGNEIQNIVVKNLITALSEFKKGYPAFSAHIDTAVVDESGAYVYLSEGRYRVYFGTDTTLQKLVRLRALVHVLEDTVDFDEQYSEVTDIDMSFSHAAVRRENNDEL